MSRSVINDLLKNIPLEVPLSDRLIEPVFTCRVWFKEAIRVLNANRVISCSDANQLEKQLVDCGEEAWERVALGTGKPQWFETVEAATVWPGVILPIDNRDFGMKLEDSETQKLWESVTS